MTSVTRRWRVTLTAALGACALVAAALTPSTAAAEPRSGDHGRHHRSVGYLALGDSVAFGYRPPEVTTLAEYLDAASFRGYPEVLARAARLRLVNASCPGETTDSMIDATAQSNGCENAVGASVIYRSAFPLHVAYEGSQLGFAVRYLRKHPRTRLVSLDIGANDLFVCQATTADHCTGTDFAATVAHVSANVQRILHALRHRAHYRHRLVLLDYYSLDYRDPVATGSIQALNAGLVRAAGTAHASVADGFGAFQRASRSTGGDACAAGLVIKLPDGTCNVHPTPLGHRVLARAVARAARHAA
jgi:lysophospholipase L1-like esterase